jgi:hypothetical protein
MFLADWRRETCLVWFILMELLLDMGLFTTVVKFCPIELFCRSLNSLSLAVTSPFGFTGSTNSRKLAGDSDSK